MADPTESYVDPLGTASATGNDYEGASFTDGVSSASGTVITKTGAFTGTRVNDKIFLTDNGSGDVTPLLYKVTARTNDTITVADVRSGAGEATDVKCTLADGTVSLPFATIQFAVDKITRDATDGDRFNIKAGVDDNVVDAAIDLTTYGTPSSFVPIIFEGYTSAAGDGGIGGISGGGSVSVLNTVTISAAYFRNLHLHNCGSANILGLDNDCGIVNCEIENTTGIGIDIDNNYTIVGCHIHNTGTAINGAQAGLVYSNHIDMPDGSSLVAISVTASCTVCFNTIRLTGSATDSDGVRYRDNTRVFNNSIWSDAGTGQGIIKGGTTNWGIKVFNNVVEGFSGTGGVGISLASDDHPSVYGSNQLYNNATHVSDAADHFGSFIAADVAPTASAPMVDPANNDFEANDVIKDTAWPSALGDSTTQYLDAGAAQQPEPAASGAPGRGSMRGGLL